MDTKTLYRLIYIGKDEEVLAAIRSYDPSKEKNPIIPLHQAIYARRRAIVESLLGQIPNDNDISYYLLHILCSEPNVIDIISSLDLDDDAINSLKHYMNVAKEMELQESVSIELLKEVLNNRDYFSDDELSDLAKRVLKEELDIAKILIEKTALMKCSSSNESFTMHVTSVNNERAIMETLKRKRTSDVVEHMSRKIAKEDHILPTQNIYMRSSIEIIRNTNPFIFYTILNIKDINGITPLHYSTKSGNLEMVRLLLSYGADPRIPTDSGDSVLRYAVMSKNIEIVKEIKDRLTHSGYIHESLCMIDAVRNNDISMMKFLIEIGVSVTVKDRIHKTPLHHAVESITLEDVVKTITSNAEMTVIEIVKLLIQHGADINARDMFRKTPLHYASKAPYILEIIELLVDNGADVNAKDRYKKTPLHNVAMIPRRYEILKILYKYGVDKEAVKSIYNTGAEIAKILIAKGADIHAKDQYHKTPLHNATRISTIVEIAKVLLEHGAKANISDKYEKTPLHNVALMSTGNIILEMFKNMGVNINERDDEGNSPLYYASKSADGSKPVSMFLYHGANANDANFLGVTPLHNACSFFDGSEIARILIENGAKVNAKTSKGMTPLHNACSLPRDVGINTVRLLIAYGANVHDKSIDGTTTLHCASRSPEIVKILLDHCVNVNSIDCYNHTPIEDAINNVKSNNYYANESMIAAKFMVINIMLKAFKYPETINDIAFIKNMAVINETPELTEMRIACENELERMKYTNICDDKPMSALLRNNIDVLVKIFKDSKIEYIDMSMFPIYRYFLSAVIDLVKQAMDNNAF